MQAILQLKDELCPHCGTPFWLGSTYDSNVEFEIDYGICNGCASKEEMTKDVKLSPGEWAGIRVVDADGGQDGLPSRGTGYSKRERPVHSHRDND